MTKSIRVEDLASHGLLNLLVIGFTAKRGTTNLAKFKAKAINMQDKLIERRYLFENDIADL